jgi:hypothetical protein
MNKREAVVHSANTIAEKEEPRVVTLKDGRTVQIMKCQVRNLGTIMDVIVYVFDELASDKDKGKGILDLRSIPHAQILKLIANGSDKLFKAVASLTTMSIKELENLELDDAIDIVMAVWEVNQAFFLKAVLPKLAVFGVADVVPQGQ